MAGLPGLGPGKNVLETFVIPFHHSPTPGFYQILLRNKNYKLFQFLCFFVFLNLSAVIAILLKPELIRRIYFVASCYIISVFANRAKKCNFNSLFSF